jgi:hypothetical protein
MIFCEGKPVTIAHLFESLPDVEKARLIMRARGWSVRRAAKAIGCTHVHLAYVLSGTRTSRSLTEKLTNIGKSPTPYKAQGFGLKKYCRRVA